jgi:predicted DNA-binding transcriptional regulator YafY
VRADRLVALVLLLQAREQTTASALAEALEVSVRTIYRDLEALSAAGVPVMAESGPGGGCRLLEGYRFPLRGLRPEEAEALLILGVPSALRDIGLESALTAAHRQIQVTSGHEGRPTLVHLDMPRWFHSQELVPCLRDLVEGLRAQKHLSIQYSRSGDPSGTANWHTVGPLGLVNKAGTWYLVAAEPKHGVTVYRAGRITSARALAKPFERPPGFELADFWDAWSHDFANSRPSLAVTVRASPEALAIFPEIFGAEISAALNAALPPDDRGWRVVTLSFEHEPAAAHRLAGFGGLLEVLAPSSVRDRLVTTANAIVDRYRTGADLER